MAHFIKLDENNVVIDAIVVNNNDLLDSDGKESESIGQEMCRNLHERGGGSDARWIQTSYNATIRGSFAGVGFSYNEELDVFLPPKPYESWVINTELKCWESPVERPEISNTEAAIWDETNQQWIIVQRPITMINLDL